MSWHRSIPRRSLRAWRQLSRSFNGAHLPLIWALLWVLWVLNISSQKSGILQNKVEMRIWAADKLSGSLYNYWKQQEDFDRALSTCALESRLHTLVLNFFRIRLVVGIIRPVFHFYISTTTFVNQEFKSSILLFLQILVIPRKHAGGPDRNSQGKLHKPWF